MPPYLRRAARRYAALRRATLPPCRQLRYDAIVMLIMPYMLMPPMLVAIDRFHDAYMPCYALRYLLMPRSAYAATCFTLMPLHAETRAAARVSLALPLDALRFRLRCFADISLPFHFSAMRCFRCFFASRF